MKLMPNSKQWIGKSRERFNCLEHYGFDWRSFYNGWLEGRADLIHDINNETCEFLVDDSYYNDVLKKIPPAIDKKDKITNQTVYGWKRIKDFGDRFPRYIRVKISQ